MGTFPFPIKLHKYVCNQTSKKKKNNKTQVTEGPHTLGVTGAVLTLADPRAFLSFELVTGLASAVPLLFNIEVPARLRSEAL